MHLRRTGVLGRHLGEDRTPTAACGVVRELSDVLDATGSELSWIPRDALEALGIATERRQRLVMVDGHVIERDVGFGIAHAAGMTTADDVVFAEPGDMLLLGARSLEGLNLRVDPILAGTA